MSNLIFILPSTYYRLYVRSMLAFNRQKLAFKFFLHRDYSPTKPTINKASEKTAIDIPIAVALN